MLVVPMQTPEGETIGALQLINCKPDFAARLVRGDAIEGTVQRFTARHEQLAGSLASQAAVAIQNRRLYENIRELFEGFVKASVTAIESRDPTTSGHSARVANLTVGLAAAIDRASDGPHRLTHFSAEEMTELRYAALLHDFYAHSCVRESTRNRYPCAMFSAKTCAAVLSYFARTSLFSSGRSRSSR